MKNIIFLLFTVVIIGLGSYLYLSNQDDVAKKIEPISKEKPLIVVKKYDIQSKEKTDPWHEVERNAPIMDYFEELIDAAKNGDADAQYHLSIVHRDCLSVPITEENLNETLDSVNTEGKTYLGSDDIVKEKIVLKSDWCKGYPRDLMSKGKWRQLVIAAARGGNSNAKIEFLGVALQSFTSEDFILKAEEVVEIKREGMQHLIDSRNMGNKDSLQFLGGQYEDGIIVDQNLIEAYANYYAFSLFSQSSSGYNFRDRFEDRLSNEEIEEAILLGERYAECCR